MASIVFLCLLLEMAFNSAIPVCFKFLVDSVLIGRDHELLVKLLAGLSIAVVMIALIGLARDYLYARLVSYMVSDLRTAMFAHLQKLSIDYFTRNQAGTTISRFSGDLNTIEHALAAAVPWAVLPGLDVIASTLLLFTLDWRLACLALLVWPMSLLGPRLFTPKATSASYTRKQEEAQTIAQVQENVSAQPVIKAFGLEPIALRTFGSRNSRLAKSGIRLGFLSAMVERSASIGIHLLQVAILGVGAWMAYNKQISIGTLAAFQTLFMSLSYSLSYVTQYVPNLVQAGGAMQHIQEMLSEPPRVMDAPTAQPLPRLQHSIQFNHVTFSYTGQTPNLREVDIQLPAGKSIAFVGPSGSGKSTMINLVMRFYDPDQGNITLDGADLRNGLQKSLRDECGVVFQDSFLFNISVRENIRLGKPEATDGEVITAARAAEIHDVIVTWPEGYETIVGERGSRLSGGQRQRIAIARAILRNPAILILDEATSALDPVTENTLNETLKHVSQGRTVLSVTHRLASVVDFDLILVFEKGRLKERGTHQELLAGKGLYHNLWQKQHGFALNATGDKADLTVEKLRELPILQKLPAELQKEIAPLFVTEQLQPERIVFTEGDAGDRFYLIVRGRVAISHKTQTGQEERLAILEDGDYFGEIALLQNTPRNATVRTLTSVLLLTLRVEQFHRLVNRVPELREELSAMAHTRVRR